jgi:ectoine hydroxylase-related dioxygenase (phytanoyl-CoA dioxygenase family)
MTPPPTAADADADAVADADASARIRFQRDGFVIFRGVFTSAEMERFIVEVQRNDPKQQRGERLSAGAMRFWSNLFYTRKAIQEFITQPALIELLVPIIGPDFWVRWDQAVEKGPQSGVFPWHQDNGYNGLRFEHFQLWIALSEMTPDNGGLWLVPGSHKRRLPHRRVGNHLEAVGSEVYDAPDANKVFVEAEQGDVVLFSSLALHKTYENATTRPRWAYVSELVRSRDYDPTVARPYFNAARDGKPYPVFTDSLPGRRDPLQRLRALPWQGKQAVLAGARRIKDTVARPRPAAPPAAPTA